MTDQHSAAGSYPESSSEPVHPAPQAPHAPPTPTPPPSAPPVGVATAIPRKQGAWELWWLCILTLGIYYLIWYGRINGELSPVLGEPVASNGQWWNQLIPIWNLVGLAATAKRLNSAHAKLGSPTRVGVVTAWLWAPYWFASQTRYLQRRINTLHDVIAAKAIVP